MGDNALMQDNTKKTQVRTWVLREVLCIWKMPSTAQPKMSSLESALAGPLWAIMLVKQPLVSQRTVRD